MNIIGNMRKSSNAFVSTVWPAIRTICGGGDIAPVEAVAGERFVRDLDTLAGIDAWQINYENGTMRGIASRVQWGVLYRTFTIRYRLQSGYATEYDKRMFALRNTDRGFLYPHLTVQAYLDGDKLLSAAVVRTERIFSVAERVATGEHVDGCGILTNRRDGNQFIYVDWLAAAARVVS